MRNKTFTLMVLAFFMSIFSFAQKPKAFDGQALKQGVYLKTSAKAPLVALPQNQKTTDSMPQPSAGKKAPAKAPEVVTPPEDGEIVYYKATGVSYAYTGTGWSNPYSFGRTVAVIWDGEKDVYISGLSHYVHDMYIHGRFVDESRVVFSMGQYLGDDLGAPVYSAAQNDAGEFIDIEAEYDDESDTFTFTTIIADCNASMNGMYAYIEEGLTIAPFDGETDLPVEAPSDLEVEDYVYSATNYRTGKSITHGVKLGFYGNDVYLQGITPDFSDTWIKGSLDGNTITFPTGQMLCEYGPYTIWFLGYGDNGPEDMVFDYDPEAGILTSDYWMIICIDKTDIANGANCWSIDSDPITIQKVTEQPGTPSNPSVSGINFNKYGDVLEMNIPLTDTDDNAMVADKLFYRLFYDTGDGEPVQVTFTPDEFFKLESEMTEVCVSFTDNYDFEAGPTVYLNMEHKSWKRIGVQSVYYGGFETHESDITWYTPVWTEVIELPEGLTVTENTFKGFTVDDETDEKFNVEFERTVNVALDGNSAIYIQGIGTEDATTWVKGVKTADNTYTFARGQEIGLYNSYRLLLVGWDDKAEAVTDVVMTVDAVSGVYTFETAFLENAGRTTRSYYLTKFAAGATVDIAGEKVKVVPATPSIDIVRFHTSGDILNFTIPTETDKEKPIADTDKLSYKIYYDEGDGEAKVVTFTTVYYEKLSKDMSEIPYGFLDDVDEEGNPKGWDFYKSAVYLNMPHDSWQRVGIQSIYTDEDDINASEIGWYTPTWPQVISLPEGAEVAEYDFKGTYYSYNGNQDFSKKVNVAFVDDAVYVQGVGSATSEAWIMGTKTSVDTYTFAKGQYMGVYASNDVYYYLFLMGYNSTLGVLDVKMTFDSETGALTSTTEIIENAEYTDKLRSLTRILAGATITPEDPNDPDAISAVNAEVAEGSVRYNIAGQRVGEDYKGIVVKSGKKFFQK